MRILPIAIVFGWAAAATAVAAQMPLTAKGRDWLRLGQTHRAVEYLDRASIMRTDQVVRVDILSVFKQTMLIEGGGKFDHRLSEMRIDCDTRRYWTDVLYLKYRHEPTPPALIRRPRDGSDPPPEGSAIGNIIRTVCQDNLLSGPRVADPYNQARNSAK